jgi:hypothetical protein
MIPQSTGMSGVMAARGGCVLIAALPPHVRVLVLPPAPDQAEISSTLQSVRSPYLCSPDCHFTITRINPFVQQHCACPAPATPESLALTRRMYVPGCVNVAVVVAMPSPAAGRVRHVTPGPDADREGDGLFRVDTRDRSAATVIRRPDRERLTNGRGGPPMAPPRAVGPPDELGAPEHRRRVRSASCQRIDSSRCRLRNGEGLAAQPQRPWSFVRSEVRGDLTAKMPTAPRPKRGCPDSSSGAMGVGADGISMTSAVFLL